jgi:hypothetical protein
MYLLFEYFMVLVLAALMCTLVFAASVVLVMVGEGIAAVLRMSRATASTGTLAKAFERARSV